MATPLFWRSFDLLQKLYRYGLYSRKISVNTATETVKAHTDMQPFQYYCKIMHVFEFFCACLYVVLKYIFKKNSVHAYLALLMFEAGSLAFLGGFFCYLAETVGDQMFENFYNKLLVFDRELRFDQRPIGYASNFQRRQLILQGIDKWKVLKFDCKPCRLNAK